jgi:hypothetical protein
MSTISGYNSLLKSIKSQKINASIELDVPSLLLAQFPVSPRNGALAFATDTNTLYVYSGGWTALSTGGGNAVLIEGAQTINGLKSFSNNTQFINNGSTANCATFAGPLNLAGNLTLTSNGSLRYGNTNVSSGIDINNGTQWNTLLGGPATPVTITNTGSLVASGITGGAQGYTVAISSDGSTMFTGAQNVNNVAVFTRITTGTGWVSQSNVTPNTGSYFGSCVATNQDGNVLVATGSTNSGGGTNVVYVYTRTFPGGTPTWTLKTSNAVAGNYGSALALNNAGNVLVIGHHGDASAAGSVYIYTLTSGGSVMTQVSKFTGLALSSFGFYVQLSGDGYTLLIGAPAVGTGESTRTTGSSYVYTSLDGLNFTQSQTLVGTSEVNGNQGSSGAMSYNGDTIVIGGQYDNTNLGAIWAFKRASGTYSQIGSKIVGTGQFGNALWLSYDSKLLYVASGASGLLTYFTYNGTALTQAGTVTGVATNWGGWKGRGLVATYDGSRLVIGSVSDANGRLWTYSTAIDPFLTVTEGIRAGHLYGSSGVTVGGAIGGSGSRLLSYPSSFRNILLPDIGSNASVMYLEGTQLVSGAKSFGNSISLLGNNLYMNNSTTSPNDLMKYVNGQFNATTINGLAVSSAQDIILAIGSTGTSTSNIARFNSTGLSIKKSGAVPREALDIGGAMALGSTAGTTVGSIQWNGTNFQGYNGTSWVNLDALTTSTIVPGGSTSGTWRRSRIRFQFYGISTSPIVTYMNYGFYTTLWTQTNNQLLGNYAEPNWYSSTINDTIGQAAIYSPNNKGFFCHVYTQHNFWSIYLFNASGPVNWSDIGNNDVIVALEVCGSI